LHIFFLHIVSKVSKETATRYILHCNYEKDAKMPSMYSSPIVWMPLFIQRLKVLS